MDLNTNGDLFPVGTYEFRVASVPIEVDAKGYVAWAWSFETETDDGPMVYNERFMIWTLAPLVRGLGFKEVTPGRFDFEPTAAMGRRIRATIVHVKVEKGASAGKVVARMQDIVPASEKSSLHRAAVAAQAPRAAADDISF